jgi:hypothetical protein
MIRPLFQKLSQNETLRGYGEVYVVSKCKLTQLAANQPHRAYIPFQKYIKYFQLCVLKRHGGGDGRRGMRSKLCQ